MQPSSFPHRYKSDIAKTINKRNKNLDARPLLLKMTATIDILIPTYRRPVALAVTLTSLVAQSWDFRIVISDQTEDSDPVGTGEFRLCCVSPCSRSYHRYHKHLPRRDSGTAPVLLEQAQVSTRFSWTTT